MLFPDCRNDNYYNERFLDKNDTEFVDGMDFMLEQICNLFENNLDVYAGRLEVETEIDVDKFLDKAKEELSEMIKDWAEMERNQMITSMIDGMNTEAYETNRKKVLKEHKNEFYNTRKFMCSGVKDYSID